MNNNLSQLKLNKNERNALEELKEKLQSAFTDIEIILYGSKVRGDFQEFSDIDILILTNTQVTRNLKEDITDVLYDIELKYNVVFGKIIENRDFWQSSLANAMPLHWNIDKEGIRL